MIGFSILDGPCLGAALVRNSGGTSSKGESSIDLGFRASA